MKIPKDLFAGKTINDDSWNPIPFEEAEESPSRAYQYSKVYAEQKAWAWMKEKSRSFDLIFLLAPSITGKSLQEGFKPEKGGLGGQPGIYTGLSDVEKPGFMYVSIFPHTFNVLLTFGSELRDVEDVARVHIEALSPSIPGNQRYLFCSHEIMSANTTALAMREDFPQLKHRTPAPEDAVGDGYPPPLIKNDLSKFEKAFGRRHWQPAKVSARETVEDIVAYNKW